MKTILRSELVKIPDGVTCEIRARVVTVKGPRGTLVKDLKHLPIDLHFVNAKTLQVDRWFTSGKANSAIRTTCSHIENMITGVTKGFKYKMRFVYAHFPINVALTNKDTRVEIRNFLGEKVVRIVDALPGVTVSRSSDIKDEIVLVGNDINNVSRTCALIQQICAVKRKDIRKFLDGIYVSYKGTVIDS
ncbi:hypothetical protein AB1Y20_003292 [Prymnesium parvum]|uniref:Large ribosomal subunit protein uL6 alpha-beta domain-containing protein n=1 Tax=Prymnesium parvum TaxID=97485 RepID=A0AB34JEE3_PRYPA|mmetsp:Transcript_10244/g.25412  ORF Transcript_10244/g.25412 Transcript_10244/m.25412 type:complete len:189 (+) Transcript_10244:39-605(+)|eukprot:CAMPEP_0182822702 /NCGR_PEP_ID=MMETSP0006_2-20121128/14353_1 /TAXON_ID=97485 /ORGANISM="Prymnesium parvum, Strain Texoma1" /LENGTH=188 /DNA_ID=CAMNT_0024949561 /DNA_START=260 /DNA_END=826 /DNA_ORIENTATION=+